MSEYLLESIFQQNVYLFTLSLVVLLIECQKTAKEKEKKSTLNMTYELIIYRFGGNEDDWYLLFFIGICGLYKNKIR